VTLAERMDVGMIRRIQHFTTQDIPVATVTGLEPKIPAPRIFAARAEGPAERPAFGARKSFGGGKPFGAKKPFGGGGKPFGGGGKPFGGGGKPFGAKKPFVAGSGGAKRSSPFQR
jgi:hypothetical protein